MGLKAYDRYRSLLYKKQPKSRFLKKFHEDPPAPLMGSFLGHHLALLIKAARSFSKSNITSIYQVSMTGGLWQ